MQEITGGMAADRPSYRRLVRIPGLVRLFLGAQFGRTATQMLSVGLVLFSLETFHSPAIAGASVFVSLVPGILMAPLAGALLDRYGRMLLVVLDHIASAVTLLILIVLNATHTLTVPLFFLVVAAGSLTQPLTNAGTRSLLPVLTPRDLWDHANAMDSLSFVASSILGPAAAGLLAGVVSPALALFVTSLLYIAGAMALAGVHAPPPAGLGGGSLFGDAWAGLVYLARHRALRGLAFTISVSNIGWGIAVVALPLLVFEKLQMGAATVGILWAVAGAAAMASAFVAGQRGSVGRERTLLIGAFAVGAVAWSVMASASTLWVTLLGLVLFGAANGPADIGLFGLRQRRTDPQWLGRIFAISGSFNFLGMPVGSLIAGWLVTSSLGLAFGVAAVCQVAAIGLALTIPKEESKAAARD